MTRHAAPGRVGPARGRADALASDLPEPREPLGSSGPLQGTPEPAVEPVAPDRPSPEPRPLSRRERSAVIARIEALMEFWGITQDDLERPGPEPVAPPAPVVKYRHPVSGETWDGVGAHPDWLRRALLKEGLRVDELKPDAGPAPAAPSSA